VRYQFSSEEEHFQVAFSSDPAYKITKTRVPRDISTMPPGFLVDKYHLKSLGYEYGDIETKGYIVNGPELKLEVVTDINHELDDYVQDLYIKRNENAELYKTYPTRLRLSASFALDNDSHIKNLKWHDYKLEIDKIQLSLDVLDLCHYWVQQVRKNHSKGPHVDGYINHHEEAHPSPNISWRQIQLYDWLNELYDLNEEVLEFWDEGFFEKGDWCIDPMTYHSGNRGRDPKARFVPYQVVRMNRCREIGYAAGVSTCGAFVKHEVNINTMVNCFDEIGQILGTEIISPKTIGGEYYTRIRELTKDGVPCQHFDVAGMELVSPSLLQGDTKGYCRGVGMCIGRKDQRPELLSGVYPTSDWTGFASCGLVHRLYLSGNIILIGVLGDDIIIFGKVKLTPSILLEPQKMDDDMNRNLGLVVVPSMHPVGRNISIDRATDRINITEERLRQGVTIKNKMPLEDRYKIGDLFAGLVGGVELSELIKKVPSEEHIYSPKEMYTYLEERILSSSEL
jgi:hypothetical protein